MKDGESERKKKEYIGPKNMVQTTDVIGSLSSDLQVIENEL